MADAMQSLQKQGVITTTTIIMIIITIATTITTTDTQRKGVASGWGCQ